MTLLDTLKSLLGLESTDRRTDDDVGVTVEREADRAPEPPSSPSGGGAGASRSTTADTAAVEDAESEPGDEADATEAEADVTEDDTAGGSDEPTDVLEGIGPTYAERLSDAGIDTVAELADADAAALAPDIENVGESRVQDWVDRASDR